MVIFSQGPTKHSRLGNSIDWMAKFQYIFDALFIEFTFPWACENFHEYLTTDSKWLRSSTAASEFIDSKFGQALTAINISHISRSIEHEYEKANYLDAYGWSRLICSDKKNGVLYLTGKVDITAPEIIDAIRSHQFTIIHEPFNFIFRKNFSLIGTDYRDLAPDAALYRAQKKFVTKNSGGKPTVGFHIRRGDYRTWQNGVYCYDDNYWIGNAQAFVSLGYAVWAFSNDMDNELQEKLISIGAVVSCSSYHIDYVRIMFMERVYGPPSTFCVTALRLSYELYDSRGKFTYLPAKM